MPAEPGRLWMIPALAVSAMGGGLHNALEGIPTASVETIAAVLPALYLLWRIRPARAMA